LIDLDDERALAAADPGGMLGALALVAEHGRRGYALGRDADADGGDVRAVVCCGMGGSGVAGEIARSLYADRLRVPLVTVRAPELPAFAGPDTLVVATSYSGGTAETLDAFEDALGRGCRIVAIASGGELARRADGRVPLVRVAEGLMPRAAFGLLTFAMFGVLERAGALAPLGDEVSAALGELEPVLETLAPSAPFAVNEAKRVARAIGSRVPVVWGAEGFAAAAAARWRTQVNENAKLPAMSAALPELDHNEVVGWGAGTGSDFVVVALRHEGERPDVATRFEPSLEIAADAGADTLEVWARGSSPLARLLSLVAIGDHAATYLALLRGADPTPIDAIVRLKRALADA
jgi:glucose/mannose-6-phosphate isomerase